MKKIIVSCFVIVIFFLTGTSYATEPKNLELIKQELIQYHDSGAYQKDQTQVIKNAETYLKERLKTPSKKPLAIVLDIDETSLSNYADMVAMSFGGTFDEIMQAEANGKDSAILPTLELYNLAKNNNVAVFFITGRTENYRAVTAKNLQEVGYKNWDGLFLKPENYRLKSPAPYKTATREQIEKRGFDIALNVGDQYSDLNGGHADRTFKLPNPYYYLP